MYNNYNCQTARIFIMSLEIPSYSCFKQFLWLQQIFSLLNNLFVNDLFKGVYPGKTLIRHRVNYVGSR
jgi:hypothetical protein